MIQLQLKKLNALTKLPQSFFGLPTLFSSYWILSHKASIPFYNIPLLVMTFVLARISGMAFNQWLDYPFDKHNPRTQNRPIVKHQVSIKESQYLALFSLLLFLVLCLCFNLKTLVLGIITASVIAIYAFTKRFTIFCHAVLGIIHALCPCMVSIALTGAYNASLLCLSGFAFFFIMANDILYACQDIDFDREYGLYSIPAFLGKQRSVKLSFTLHLCALAHVFTLGYCLNYPIFFLSLLVFMIFPLIPLYNKQTETSFFIATLALPLILFLGIFFII